MVFVNSFFDQMYEGEFNLLHFSVSLTNAPTNVSEIRKLDLDPNATLEEWMRRTSTFHEFRHYHDLIGTTCGFHTILHVTRLVDLFLTECQKNGRGVLRVPLRKSEPHSLLVRLYDDYQHFLRTVFGDFPLELAQEEVEELDVRSIRALNIDFNVPFFGLTDIDAGTGLPRTRMTAIGLRPLMESTALETQLFLSVVGSGPYEAPDHQELRARGERFFLKWGSIIRSGFIVPYGICHIFYHYVTNKFPPLATVGAFADAAMVYSGFSEAVFPDDPLTFDHPGIIFCHMINAARDVHPNGSLANLLDAASASLDLPVYSSVITQMADRLESDPTKTVPAIFRPENAETEFIAKLRQYMFRDHAAIMKERASDPGDWLLALEYLKKYSKIPLPPMASLDGNTTLHRSGPEMAMWVTWIFILELIGTLIEGDELTCPIYSKLQGLGKLFSFPDPDQAGEQTNCTRFIEQELCGKYNGHFKVGQPLDCPFAAHTHRILEMFSYDGVVFTQKGES